ncbi:helix-turn-helix domain-containing protein [candidate division WOR-3 bacterium]|nr:helix-turn-helix domain-containing protein [candidate division WOR-3 bacterium]
MAKPIGLRIRVVDVVGKGQTIAEATQHFGVSAWTVRRWLRKYQEGGFELLTKPRPYIRPWNTKADRIAEKVFLLKEECPKITLSEARSKLSADGIQLSMWYIWKIWRRYGLTAYKREMQVAEIIPRVSIHRDVQGKINNAAKVLERNGDVRTAAKILNRLPYCGWVEILERIPYRYLGLRRRVEKIPHLYGKEPLHKLYQKIHSLRLSLEKRKLFYSSLRAGIAEANTLFWMGKPMQTLSVIRTLEKKIPKQGDPILAFILTLLQGMSLARLLKLDDAVQCATECKRLTRRLSAPDFCVGLGNLYSNIGLYPQAKKLYRKAIHNVSETTRTQCLLALAGCYALNGEYQKVAKTIGGLQHKESPPYTLIPLIRAQTFLGKGMLSEAAQSAYTAMQVARKDKILQYLHTATTVLACVYYALGEKSKAKSLVQSVTPVLRKNHMMQDYYIRGLYFSKDDIRLPSRYKDEPFIKLILLIKKANQTSRVKDYGYAARFATRKGLLGYFHRLCIFHPEIVLKLLEKGKPTGLPRAMLNLPVFRKEIPVYSVKFLGNLIVFKNQKYQKIKLTPKDTAFLIHLATARSRHIPLERIYTNFWPDSKNPARNLAHLLVRLRRALCLPSHFLYVKDNRLYFDCHFITDYGEYLEHLAQAKAFSVAGEWEFARKEYSRAFSLFRAAPFARMYDDWSEDMRNTVLNSIENEATKFAQACVENGERSQGIATLQKISSIIPHSDEIQDLSSTLATN